MNITIVGGGTAGWFSALYAKKTFPHSNVILIESDKIGILGAGEASTPHLISFLNFLDISLIDIIKNTNATIKNSAKFTNWSNDKNHSFYHPFLYLNTNISEQIDNQIFFPYFESMTNKFHIYASLINEDMDQYCFINKICNNNLTPFYKNDNIEILNNIGLFSLNFDASLLAKYLRKIAENRGIIRKEGIVNDLILNSDGEVEKILLQDNQKINTDFVFDCTGFARMIIGKKYNSRWISYKQYLPTNKALPFFLDVEKEKDIPTHIEAIAMDYGWMWKTPLQNRYGCGYVFDENYISADIAKEEIEKKLGFEIFPPKIFSYEPGCYEEVWIKNCLAVGLSSSFVEPLEATSLMQTIDALYLFFVNKENIVEKKQTNKDFFNKRYLQQSDSIKDYIVWHYITNKTNTDFWKNFTKNNVVPDFIQYLLSNIKNRTLFEFDFLGHQTDFFLDDYLYVLYGHKLLDKNILDQYSYFLSTENNAYNELKQNQDITIKKLLTHRDFLVNVYKYVND
jgi:tryptophan halogenase